MRLDIVGKDTTIVPHLVGRIADRIENLNAPHKDIGEARVTLLQQNGQYEARVRLLLVDKTFFSVQYGATPDAAIGAALQCVEKNLLQRRAQKQQTPTCQHSKAPMTPYSYPINSPFILE